MRLDPDQLEWIVREVVRRLQETVSSSSLPSAGATSTVAGGDRAQAVVRAEHRGGERGQRNQPASQQSADLAISDRLVTLARLENQLNGIARLHVAHRTVVTPAARDLLKERGVELVRGDQR